MTSNGQIYKYRAKTGWHFLLDFLIICFAFVLGTRIRFEEGGHFQDWLWQLSQYTPGILAGAIALPVFLYIAGMYSSRFHRERSVMKIGLILLLLFAAATVVMFAVFYVNFSTRVGRGVMLISWPVAAGLLFLHHAIFLSRMRTPRERIAFLIGEDGDAAELEMLRDLDASLFNLVGVIGRNEEEAKMLRDMPYLGSLDEAQRAVSSHRVTRLVCSEEFLRDPVMRPILCEMRYSGTTVSPVLSMCEEEFQIAPLELVTANWLLTASDSPRLIYIKKIKRGFDIAASLACLAALWPFLLLGMFLVKVTSKGPVFYRQVRMGRFGNHFSVIKLRTMVENAESNGAQWSSQGDPRTTLVGKYLRKFRVDEIPQLLNVFRGQMSFVGPRPERPEFVEELREEIPWYLERQLIQPGLTGWAQVNYPYGASIKDAVRKLEFDLYYMKHMGLYLDMAILLQTVRTILTGGVHHERMAKDPLKRDFARYQELETVQPAPVAASTRG